MEMGCVCIFFPLSDTPHWLQGWGTRASDFHVQVGLLDMEKAQGASPVISELSTRTPHKDMALSLHLLLLTTGPSRHTEPDFPEILRV
jgi:hypothetical protein